MSDLEAILAMLDKRIERTESRRAAALRMNHEATSETSCAYFTNLSRQFEDEADALKDFRDDARELLQHRTKAVPHD